MPSLPPPLAFEWSGEVMVPKNPRLAERYFTVGQVYPLEVRDDRSAISHRHYFVAVSEAHANLPERIAERFASAEHLRKYALIKAGFRDERSIVCGSEEEAAKVAAFVRPMDDFSVVTTDGPIVTVWTAKSQSMSAMSKAEFQASKDAVLSFIASLIGTDARALQRHAGEVA